MPPVHLKIVEGGLKGILSVLIPGYLPSLKWGLYQNDVAIVQQTNIGDIHPANFSGYTGLKLSSSWTVPVITGPRAITKATPLSWAHNGGPQGNWIYGFYVVDVGGLLVLAQPIQDGPILLENTSGGIIVIPTFSEKSEH